MKFPNHPLFNFRKPQFTHGSFFSGIGGFDLAAEWMGWENMFHVEIEPFNQKILNYYWPNAKQYDDITTTNFTFWRGRIDIITGGFPCQPFSLAGERKGTEDERNLWPEMLRGIREIMPQYVVGENVYGIINWNGGVVFEQIIIDLENIGYQVQPVLLPAAGVNAPHKRDRFWFVAYNANGGTKRPTPRNGFKTQKSRQHQKRHDLHQLTFPNFTRSKFAIVSHARRPKLQGRKQIGIIEKTRTHKRSSTYVGGSVRTTWQKFPIESPIRGGNDGLPRKLDGITISKWAQQSLKGYGNAVVPNVVYEIFKVIEKLEDKK